MTDARMLGPYRLERVLGTGSFATVWLALDEVLDRRVAVKILADNWSQDNEVRRRFLAEARVLLTAESPRIVRGFHLGETPTGQPYLVMAWADRGTLGDRIEQREREGRTFDVQEVVGIASEIAYALVDVHMAGHLHRDVKPTNVLIRSSSTIRSIPGLAPDETIVLADFGLARGLDMTSLTLVAGSPGYVAPEQAGGLTQLDRRADLYSVGRIMLELLTGDPGGRATTMAGAAAERIDVPGVLAGLTQKGIDAPPPQLVQLVSRLVAERPDDRPSTADEVAAELNAVRSALAAPGAGPARRPLTPPSAPPTTGPPPPGGRQQTGTQLSAPLPRSMTMTPKAKRLLGAGAVLLAVVVGVIIAISRGGGGGDADGGTTTTVADHDTLAATPLGDSSAPSVASSDPAVVPVESTTATTATTTPAIASTEPVVATSSSAAPGSIPDDAKLRLPRSSFEGPPDVDDPSAQVGSRVGSVEDFVDLLLEGNSEWSGDRPDVDAETENVDFELAGPEWTANVHLQLVGLTSGATITAFEISYR